MSQKHSPAYTLVFVTAVSVVCALLLAVTADLLRDRIKRNERLEVQRKILGSFGLVEDDMQAKEIEEVFENRLEIRLVNVEGKTFDIEGRPDVAKLEPWKAMSQALATFTLTKDDTEMKEVRLPVYCLKGDDGSIKAYSIPLWGKGLWGPIYGYLALDSNATDVRGITFSAPKETPGLGAEIENQKFREQWEGKEIFGEDGDLTPITVVKGVAEEKLAGKPDLLDHHVDGISGATLTCKGVNAMMETTLGYYKPYLNKLKKGEN